MIEIKHLNKTYRTGDKDIVALEDGPAPASYATVAGLLLTTLRGLEPRGDGNTFKRIFGGLFG